VSKSLVEIKGFPELQSQLKRFVDRVKRKEVLKILGQVANPSLKAAQGFVPVSTQVHYRYTGVKKGIRRTNVTGPDKIKINPRNLKKSLKKIVAKRSKINAILDVGAKAARRKGKTPDGYYAHMVVKKGFKGTKRVGKTNDFLKKAYDKTKGGVTKDSEKRVERYLQKQINRLSKV